MESKKERERKKRRIFIIKYTVDLYKKRRKQNKTDCSTSNGVQKEKERVSKLVFYAQSTGTVISGRETDRQTERQEETERWERQRDRRTAESPNLNVRLATQCTPQGERRREKRRK